MPFWHHKLCRLMLSPVACGAVFMHLFISSSTGSLISLCTYGCSAPGISNFVCVDFYISVINV